MVGNKCDLADQRTVNEEEGRTLAKQYGASVLFTEASAKSNINIDKVSLEKTLLFNFDSFQIFQELIREIKKAKVGENVKPKKEGGCCCVIV